MRRPTIVAYVSGHGYGHFTRSAAVLERLASRADVHARTNGRALALASREPWLSSVAEADVGPGVAQRGPLAIDLAATRESLSRYLHDWEDIVEKEAATLRALGADLVFADVPPIAFAAAARAGVPSIGLGNFSWSWIYGGFVEEGAVFREAEARFAEAESRATRFLALEMGGGLEVFAARVAIAPIVRKPAIAREIARRALGDDGRPLVLLSFGGFGGELDPVSTPSADYQLLVTSAPIKLPNKLIDSLTAKDVRPVEPTPSLPHHEIVAAVDCVIGKPGYGTVAECLARQTPLAFVPRGLPRELPHMIAGIRRWLPSAELSPEALAAGAWPEAVARAIASRAPDKPPIGDGISQAVSLVEKLL